MEMVRSQLRVILEPHYPLPKTIYQNEASLADFGQFLLDKRNASLGDSLTNFLYSCAISLSKRKMTGVKVSDRILVEGYQQSQLRSWLPLHGNRKDQANGLEALVFYVWVVHEYTTEEMSLVIRSVLQGGPLGSNDEEKRTAAKAFTKLFNTFHNLLYENEA